MAQTVRRTLPTLLFLLPFAVPGTGAAQADGSGRPVREPAPREWELDRVVAICGDTVITFSTIRESLVRSIRADPGGPEAVTPLRLREMQEERTRRALEEAILADMARTLGEDPQQVERAVDRFWEEYIREETAMAGSTAAYVQRLQDLGVTLQQHEQEKRAEIKRDLLHHHTMGRFRPGGDAVVVTPAAMRRHFRLHRDEFALPPSVDVEAVLVDIAGPQAEESASTARALLAEGRPVEEVVAEVGGARSIHLPRVEPSSAHQRPLREAALALEEGGVSEPLLLERTWWILRATARREAREPRFEDPWVQTAVQTQLLRREEAAFRLRQLEEATRRAYIWPPDAFLR